MVFGVDVGADMIGEELIPLWLVLYAGFAGLLCGFLYGKMRCDVEAVKRSEEELLENRFKWLEQCMVSIDKRVLSVEINLERMKK